MEPIRADVHNRDGAVSLLKASRISFPLIKSAFADSAYDATGVREATVIAIKVVRKLADQIGFIVLPRRWIVGRFFAWINRNRQLAKDFERPPPLQPKPLPSFSHAAQFRVRLLDVRCGR
jgi:transposase